MKEIYKTIIIGTNTIGEKLSEIVRPLVKVIDNCETLDKAYEIIKKDFPQVVFIEVKEVNEYIPKFLNFLKKTNPHCIIFFIAHQKDPDLLLMGLRSGIDDFILYPFKKDEVLATIQKSINKHKVKGKNTGEMISIFSLKGGQGVTTIATNLTDHIQQLTDNKVALVDLNFYMSDISIFLNISPAYTPFDMVKDLQRMDEQLLFSSLTRHPRNFYILSVADDIIDAEDIRGADIENMLKIIKKHMNYSIIDLPHDFSERTLSAIDVSDIILIIVQQSLPVIKSVQKALYIFDEVGLPKEKIKIVLNRYIKNSDITIKDISRILKHPITYTIRNDYKSINESINNGKTLDMLKINKINQDIKNIAMDITNIISYEYKKTNMKNFFKKFFNKQ